MTRELRRLVVVSDDEGAVVKRVCGAKDWQFRRETLSIETPISSSDTLMECMVLLDDLTGMMGGDGFFVLVLLDLLVD